MTVAGEPVALERVHAGEPVVFGGFEVAPAVQTMITAEGLRVWVGQQRPTVVVGAQVGDMYLDAATGLLYRLD